LSLAVRVRTPRAACEEGGQPELQTTLRVGRIRRITAGSAIPLLPQLQNCKIGLGLGDQGFDLGRWQWQAMASDVRYRTIGSRMHNR
jgi:hypothetical protein